MTVPPKLSSPTSKLMNRLLPPLRLLPQFLAACCNLERVRVAGTLFLLWRIPAKIFALSSPRRNPRSLTHVSRVPWDCGLDRGCNMPMGTRRGNTDDQCPFRFIQIGAVLRWKPYVWGRDWLPAALPLVLAIRFQPYLRHDSLIHPGSEPSEKGWSGGKRRADDPRWDAEREHPSAGGRRARRLEMNRSQGAERARSLLL
jgi:hypothetical protein